MKLDHTTLISPFPLYIENVGNIKSPTLREIFDPNITYIQYKIFITLLLMDIQKYCESINTKKKDWFNKLSDEGKKRFDMFDIIGEDTKLQEEYCKLLNFFFVENVVWNDFEHAYFTYTDTNKDGVIIPTGCICKGTWVDICDIILQLNNVSKKSNEKKLKFKSELAREVWELTHEKDQDNKADNNLELGNIISSVAAKDESLNMLNIWDLTVYQLYDQFWKHQINSVYNFSSTRVAVWGDEKNKFDIGDWYKNINKD